MLFLVYLQFDAESIGTIGVSLSLKLINLWPFKVTYLYILSDLNNYLIFYSELCK